MNETIYTIPINEAFGRYDGCPMCRLYHDLEKSSLDFIMGAAMMEPDVRIKTNEQGFCRKHLDTMLAENNKLSLALMLESRLPELDKSVFGCTLEAADKKYANKMPFAQARNSFQKLVGISRDAAGGCYVCGRVSAFMEHYYENIIHMWKKEPEFREKFGRQPFFCVPHYADLLAYAQHCLPRKTQPEFIRELTRICRAYLAALSGDISEFCKSFDYRFAGRGMSGGAHTAVERAAAFLAGE